MNTLFLKELSAFVCAVSLAMLPMDSIASHHHGHGGGDAAVIGAAAALGAVMLTAPLYNNGGYYSGRGPAYYGPPEEEYEQCAWVRGHHDRYGYWIPSHEECW